jgi:hypothetical protein
LITCYVHYELNPSRISEFEEYARAWVPLVQKFGGTHHGYYLPHESPNDLAVCLFSFPSLAEYEAYRIVSIRRGTRSSCVDSFLPELPVPWEQFGQA